MEVKDILTRREACALFATLGMGAVGLAGCSLGGQSSDPTARAGFANDTEVKSYPVHLKIYVDSYLQWHLKSKGPQTNLENHIERYQQQKDRAEVSFEVAYASSAELLAMAREGFPDGDGLLAFQETVTEGCASGTVDAGVANLSVRDLGYHYREHTCLVRVLGSEVALPPAVTLTGEDAPDGSINRLQQLPQFDGVIALADPSTTLEGLLANRALAAEEFYSERSGLGSSYRESIAAKIVAYPNQDAAMAAVVTGECQLGFALQRGLNIRYPEVEEVYRPAYGGISYDGAALTRSAEPGVMKDFFTFEQACSD
ncbi:MAG: hypothetical protein LBK67_11090 [Coriobacteriales bacterium]|jgi:hypothetical protein|nr:hypothetical protein [Coriobacteriales bacterium]